MRVTALALLLAYLSFVGWLTFRPVSAVWVAPANLDLFASISAEFQDGPGPALRALGAGLGLLAPLGLLLPLTARRLGGGRFASLTRTVFVGAMVSLTIELLHSTMPSRVADVDALLLNTLGVALVHLLCYGRLRALALRDRRTPAARTVLRQEPAPPRGPTPKTPRVGITPEAEVLDHSLPVR